MEPKGKRPIVAKEQVSVVLKLSWNWWQEKTQQISVNKSWNVTAGFNRIGGTPVSGFAFEDLFHWSLEFFMLDHTITIDIQNFEEVSSALESIFHKSVPQHTCIGLPKCDFNHLSLNKWNSVVWWHLMAHGQRKAPVQWRVKHRALGPSNRFCTSRWRSSNLALSPRTISPWCKHVQTRHCSLRCWLLVIQATKMKGTQNGSELL